MMREPENEINNLFFIFKYDLISQSDSAHQIKNYPKVCKWFLINKELISAIQLLITIIKLNNKKLKSWRETLKVLICNSCS